MKNLLTLTFLLFVTTTQAQLLKVGQPLSKVVDIIINDTTVIKSEIDQGQNMWIRAYYYNGNECDPAYEFCKIEDDYVTEVQYNYYTGRCEHNANIQMTRIVELDSTLTVEIHRDTTCDESTFFYTVKRDTNERKAIRLLSDTE